ncbi:neurexin-2-like isoform X1 [Anolis carolinensis]|uniref:neurexin-2-like isoform X1 n=1 Tax=Anolis carolinensis TaxID=28377 RepID=UPI002F2B6E16
MAKPVRLLVPLALLVASMLSPGAGGAALEFSGTTGQWARYARWDASSLGELSFSLKTNVSRALVLYLDDGGNCDFLELLILEGRFRLRFTISCAEPASLHLETPVNDDRWHMLLLTRNYRETMLVVDGEARVAEVKSKRRDMTVESDLFVGGIPPDVRLSALTLSTVKYEMPFRGIVANLKVGDMPPALLGSQGIRSDMEYLCTKQNPCVNGGICTVINSEVQCDCSLTGFQGKFCSEGPAHLTLNSQGGSLLYSEGGTGRGTSEVHQTSKGQCKPTTMSFRTCKMQGQCLPLLDLFIYHVRSKLGELIMYLKTQTKLKTWHYITRAIQKVDYVLELKMNKV